MKLNTIVIAICLITVNLGIGQDLHFSQFSQAPLQMNPALTGGSEADQRAILNYKDQWRSVAKAYRTYAFSYDLSLSKKMKTKNHLGIGVNVFAARSGDVNLSTTQADLFLAYHIKMNDHHSLSGGLRGGLSQRSINETEMQWGNQYDSNVGGYNSNMGSNETIEFDRFLHADFAAGLNWSYSSKNATLSSNDATQAEAGFSVLHVNAPKLNYNSVTTNETLYTRYILHGKLRQGIKNTNLQIEPGGYAQFKKTSKEIVVGANVRYIIKEESKYTNLVKGAAISVGTHYRIKDALIVSSYAEFGNFGVGLSYDINISGLSKATNTKGGFEIALLFRTPNPFKDKKSAARFM